ncbi:hypothetical protein BDV96DRAFT_587818, partial [Lophiotrema nucula]
MANLITYMRNVYAGNIDYIKAQYVDALKDESGASAVFFFQYHCGQTIKDLGLLIERCVSSDRKTEVVEHLLTHASSRDSSDFKDVPEVLRNISWEVIEPLVQLLPDATAATIGCLHEVYRKETSRSKGPAGDGDAYVSGNIEGVGLDVDLIRRAIRECLQAELHGTARKDNTSTVSSKL